MFKINVKLKTTTTKLHVRRQKWKLGIKRKLYTVFWDWTRYFKKWQSSAPPVYKTDKLSQIYDTKEIMQIILIHHSYEESYILFINYRKLFMVDKSRGIRCLNVFSKKEKTITLHFISYTIGLIITWHYCVILEKHILKTKYIRRWIQLL